MESAEMTAIRVMDCVTFLHDGQGASGRRQRLSDAASLIEADRLAVTRAAELALLERIRLRAQALGSSSDCDSQAFRDIREELAG